VTSFAVVRLLKLIDMFGGRAKLGVPVALAAVLGSIVPASAAVNHLVSGPHIAVTASSFQSVVTGAGQTLNFSFSITNDGTVGLDAVSVSQSLAGASTAVCPVSSLASGSGETCTSNYVVTQRDVNVGSVSSSATASGTPSGGPTVTSAPSMLTDSVNLSPLPDLGIDVNFGGQAILPTPVEMNLGRQVFTYVSSLGANAVSISFPYYEVGQTPSNGAQTSNGVTSGPGTPSVQLLASVVRLAESYGLRVQLRPTLSQEGDAPLQWHGTIAPTNPAAWINSYLTWLTPYLVMARENGVESFGIASELNSMLGYTQYWNSFVHRARTLFGNNLLYSQSRYVSTTSVHYESIPGVLAGYDAYQPVKPPNGTTVTSANAVSVFTSGIEANLRPAGFAAPLRQTRIEELGLSAVVGAWTFPPAVIWPSGVYARWVQASWFTANCNAFQALHMAGIYFWQVDYGAFNPAYNANTNNDINAWQGTQTESAVKSCFASSK